MCQTTIEDRIKQVLVQDRVLKLDIDQISNDAALLEDIGLDSIQVLELIVGLEIEFDFTLADEDLSLELFSSVSSLAAYVRRKLAGETVSPFVTESSDDPMAFPAPPSELSQECTDCPTIDE